MNFLERDLEDIVYQTSNQLLQQRGLPIEGIKKRQVRIGNYGIADLITISRDSRHEDPFPNGDDVNYYFRNDRKITIYELKQNEINHKTLFQAYRYKVGVDQYLEKRELDYRTEIVLIGKKVEMQSDFCYCLGKIEGITAYTYEYLFDGINFVCQNRFTLIDKGF